MTTQWWADGADILQGDHEADIGLVATAATAEDATAIVDVIRRLEKVMEEIGSICYRARVPVMMRRSQDPQEVVVNRAVLLLAIEAIESIAGANAAEEWKEREDKMITIDNLAARIAAEIYEAGSDSSGRSIKAMITSFIQGKP